MVPINHVAGEALLTQTYDPYGNLYARAGADVTGYGFTGEQEDSSGLLYLRARYYAPEMGRFLNMDPSRMEMNPYQYGLGNPISHTDPTGLCVVTLVTLGGGGVGTLATAAVDALCWAVVVTGYYVYVIPPQAKEDTAEALANVIDWCGDVITAPNTRGDTVVTEDWQNMTPIYQRPTVTPTPNPNPTPEPQPDPVPTPGRAPVPVQTRTPEPEITLYHYTFAENIPSILATGLRPSLEGVRDAHYGSGQYFTDLTPTESSTVTRYQHSYALFRGRFFWGGNASQVKPVGWIEIRVPVNEVTRKDALFGQRFPHRSVFLHSSTENWSIAPYVQNTGTVNFAPSNSGIR